MFITFEGIEGSGKTTQIQRLKVELEKRGHPVLCTKEPGGTALGLKIRQFLLDTKTDFQSQYTELLLFYIDRLEHIKQRVEPALEKGITVLCDRYIDSTIAYQVGGRGLKQQLVQTLSDLVNLTPDKTILLDLSPEEGLKRAEKRARLDRFEKESLEIGRAHV